MQRYEVITYQVFTRCQQSAKNSIKCHFGNLATVKLLLICIYRLMHCACSLHGGKKELLVFVCHFVGQERVRSLSNLVECNVNLPYRSFSGLFISTT